MCVCVCYFYAESLVDYFLKNCSLIKIYLSVNYVKKVWRKIYLYDLYSPSKHSLLHTHTHTHTHRVLHDSSDCHHTPLNIQIFWTVKSYRPISGWSIFFSLWIASPWRQNHCDPSKLQYLCISTHGLPCQKNWIFSNPVMRTWNVASDPRGVIVYTRTWNCVNVRLSLCYLNSMNLGETSIVSAWLQQRQVQGCW